MVNLSLREELRIERNSLVFEQRLAAALRTARSGGTSIVIVPPDYPKSLAVTTLVHMLDKDTETHARAGSDALHFEGTRGQVRIYHCDHVTYDRPQRRLLDYPAGTPHFLHPEVEELI